MRSPANLAKHIRKLLRDWAKKSPQRSLPYLARIRARPPRLVLRTACAKLTAAQRAQVLAKQ